MDLQKYTKEETIDHMERGIKSAGIIILVTGGGGALEWYFVTVAQEIISHK